MENLSRYGRLLWIRKIRHHTNGVCRYKGKYPKKFEEKYKELQPEKYQDTIQHVIQKGNTPAGMHISIMVAGDSGFFTDPAGSRSGFDATLGYGGHTKAMLQCLKGPGPYVCYRCGPGGISKDEKAPGRAGLWGRHADDQVSRTSVQSMRSPKKWAVLISFWRIWVFLPCRSTTRSVDFLSR